MYIGNEIMDKVRNKISALTEDFADNLYYDREEYINAVSEEVGYDRGIKETAKKMLEDHVPVEAIIKYTGLTKEEMADLEKE